MSSAPSKARQYAAYALLAWIWGSTWMAIRVVVEHVPPVWAAAIRFAIASVILFIALAIRGTTIRVSSRELKATLVLSFTMMAVPYGLIFWAEQHITSSLTAVLFSILPLVVALLTPLMTNHRVPREVVLNMTIGAGAIAYLFWSSLTMTPSLLLGGAAVLTAMFLSAWSAVYAKTRVTGLDSITGAAMQLGIGAIVLFGVSALTERGRPATWTPAAVWSILFLAIAGSAMAFGIYYWLLRFAHPYQLSVISLVIPIIAMLEGALILREHLPWTMLIAALLVIRSVASVLKSEEPDAISLNLREATK